jgi:hypothetical protein
LRRASFEKYCHENGIGFDEASHQMAAGPKPRTGRDKMKEFPFLLAALGRASPGSASWRMWRRSLRQ